MKTDSLLAVFKEFSLKEELHENVVGGKTGYTIQTSTGVYFEWYDNKGYVCTTNQFGRPISQTHLDATEDVGGK